MPQKARDDRDRITSVVQQLDREVSRALPATATHPHRGPPRIADPPIVERAPDGIVAPPGLLTRPATRHPATSSTQPTVHIRIDVIFGLFRLLGYQYSPRLADAGGATFWRSPLNTLARYQVNTPLVEQHYDDLLRVAGSLLQRHTTASQLVRALRSHTRHLASLAKALQHVGRAAKTIHLLDYCNDQPFRRRILTQLNRGESRHALARDVCHGYRGELRQRYRQGQEEQLGALGLIVNAIVLYNTTYTERALDHLTAAGHVLDDAGIERLSPLGSDHITLTGRYRIALPEPLRDSSAYRPLNTTRGVIVAA